MGHIYKVYREYVSIGDSPRNTKAWKVEPGEQCVKFRIKDFGTAYHTFRFPGTEPLTDNELAGETDAETITAVFALAVN